MTVSSKKPRRPSTATKALVKANLALDLVNDIGRDIRRQVLIDRDNKVAWHEMTGTLWGRLWWLLTGK
jgi:hypothetical protein